MAKSHLANFMAEWRRKPGYHSNLSAVKEAWKWHFKVILHYYYYFQNPSFYGHTLRLFLENK